MQAEPRLQHGYKTMRTLPERIWFIKSNIRIKTWVNQRVVSRENCKIPPGLELIKGPNPPHLLKDARNELVALFADECGKKRHESRLPFQDYRKDRGLYYIFGTDLKSNERYINCGDGMALLPETYDKFKEFIRGYVSCLQVLFGIIEEVSNREVMLLLLKYEHGSGLWLHVDNVARTDGVPICTVSIGPSDVNVDFVPVRLLDRTKSKFPMRLNLNEGDMLMMQGESRYEWAHGIPYGLGSEKYTIMFKFNQVPESMKVVGYSDLLETEMHILRKVDG